MRLNIGGRVFAMKFLYSKQRQKGEKCLQFTHKQGSISQFRFEFLVNFLSSSFYAYVYRCHAMPCLNSFRSMIEKWLLISHSQPPPSRACSVHTHNHSYQKQKEYKNVYFGSTGCWGYMALL